MTYETDERLKGYLDTNQLHRERMCLAVLAADRRFSDVRPRHPRGGPDGARDIEALYEGQQRVFGAVGFVNQANDSEEHKRRSTKKFQDDLNEVLQQTPRPEVFVFFTNVNLTIGEKDDLAASAKNRGLAHAEIFDRERIRIVLDSAEGLSVRFQYLGIPLSEAEQASFFARWGDDIQSLLNTGFGALEKSLKRIHFMQEANLPLNSLWVSLQLDREYSGSEIGHFRAFALFQYVTPVNNVFSVLFGAADNRARNDAAREGDLLGTRFGISEGIAGAQWEQRIPEVKSADHDTRFEPDEDQYLKSYSKVGSSTSIGRERIKAIACSYSKRGFYRFEPGPRLIDVNEAHYILFVNRSLAERISVIRVFANDYKLAELAKETFSYGEFSSRSVVPMVFTAKELADPWVRITPTGASLFDIDFSGQTPRRFYSAVELPDDAG
jgi:hypothetical protein